MNADTEDSWKLFLPYWLSTYNYMLETGDSSYFNDVSVDGCEFCDQAKVGTATMRKDDKTWRVGKKSEFLLKKAKRVDVKNGYLRIDIPVVDYAATFYTEDGKSQKYDPLLESTTVVRVWLDKPVGHWRVAELADRKESSE